MGHGLTRINWIFVGRVGMLTLNREEVNVPTRPTKIQLIRVNPCPILLHLAQILHEKTTSFLSFSGEYAVDECPICLR